MIYPLITTNSTTWKDTLRDALIASGKMGTIYYDSGNNIVFSLIGHQGVIKIMASSIYHGDAWTSTTTITNQISLFIPFNAVAAGMDSVLVTGPGYIAITLNQGASPGIGTFVFTIDTDGRDIFLGFGTMGSTSYNNTYCYDLVTREELFPALRPRGLLTDASGLLFTIEVILKNTGNFIKTTSITNIKVLCLDYINSTHSVYGTEDVAVSANLTSDGGSSFGVNLLLLKGNI